MGALHITKENFETEVLKSEVPVLVDFWAEWCGPCKMMGPLVDEIADEMGDKIKVGRWYNSKHLSQAGLRFHEKTDCGTYVFKNGSELFYTALPRGRHPELLEEETKHIQLSKYPKEFWEVKGKYEGKGPFKFGLNYAKPAKPKRFNKKKAN